MPVSWTVERVKLLINLWMDGRSASQIAEMIGHGTTRNSVIGKIHRMKLAGRAKSSPAAPLEPRPPRPARPTPSLRKGLSEWIAAGFTAEDRADALAAEAEKRKARVAMRERGGHALSRADRAPVPASINPVVTISPPRVERTPATVKALAEVAEAGAVALVAPASLNLTLFELGDGQCRWVADDGLYCGATSEFKSSYCRFHAKISYQPHQDRRRWDKRLLVSPR
jgi:GcrA cell cycle regulator